jgi:hypothetical protein
MTNQGLQKQLGRFEKPSFCGKRTSCLHLARGRRAGRSLSWPTAALGQEFHADPVKQLLEEIAEGGELGPFRFKKLSGELSQVRVLSKPSKAAPDRAAACDRLKWNSKLRVLGETGLGFPEDLRKQRGLGMAVALDLFRQATPPGTTASRVRAGILCVTRP